MQGLIQVFLMIRFVGFGSCSWSELWRLLGKLLNTFFFLNREFLVAPDVPGSSLAHYYSCS